jgi:hypothetical protein
MLIERFPLFIISTVNDPTLAWKKLLNQKRLPSSIEFLVSRLNNKLDCITPSLIIV